MDNRYINDQEVSMTAVQVDPTKAGNPSRAKAILSLMMGIFSLYFGMIPGIICAIIGKKSANEFIAENADSQYSTMAIIGKILSCVGLPYAIAQVCLLYYYTFVFCFIYILMMVLSLATGAM